MSSNCITDTSKLCFNHCCVNSLRAPDAHTSSPKADPRREFKTAILSTIQPNTTFTNHESLPSLTQLFSTLIRAFPQYLGTVLADDIRTREYSHLSVSNRVCLDYVGNGLFSHSQLSQNWNEIPVLASSSSSSSSVVQGPFFTVSYRSGGSPFDSQESGFEVAMRDRIMKYMNLFEEDYSLVITANKSSAMKLVADSYPFKSNRNILTVYDYENECVQAMVGAAIKNGARPLSACFSWPSLRVSFSKLRKLLVNNRQKHRGLFVFPLQSRITGSRYSHQWMTLARDNGWHVLLDATALGAKDMETLGLSLFQPDFIISSFFKIFGLNPSGFCCLFIKKSSLPNLSISSTSIGVVSLIPEKGPFSKSTPTEINPQIASTSESQHRNEEIHDHQTPSTSKSQLKDDEFVDETNHQTPSRSDSLKDDEFVDEAIHQTPSGSNSQLKDDESLGEAIHQTPSGSNSQLKDDESLGEAIHQTPSGSNSQLKDDESLGEAIHQTPSGSNSQLKDDESLGEAIHQTPSRSNPEPKHKEIVQVDEHPEAIQFRNKNKSSSRRTKFDCQGLNHADTLGLILISTRTRILSNWLVNALQSLKHPNTVNGLPLVRIYGPKIKLDRGPAVAFNVYDWKGEKVDPILVQKLADRNNISVSCGFLKNLLFSKDLQTEKEEVMESRRSSLDGCEAEKKKKGKRENGIEVVTVYVGMLSNFEDIVRIWSFVARFLDADFVEKERWRYTALNQTAIVEV